MTLPCEPGVDTSQKVAEAGSDQGLRVQVLFDAAGHAGAGSELRRAYDIAAACHDGQLRLSGDPYITHPVEVALICQDLGMSPAVQCAAQLHDVLIDTAYTTGQCVCGLIARPRSTRQHCITQGRRRIRPLVWPGVPAEQPAVERGSKRRDATAGTLLSKTSHE